MAGWKLKWPRLRRLGLGEVGGLGGSSQQRQSTKSYQPFGREWFREPLLFNPLLPLYPSPCPLPLGLEGAFRGVSEHLHWAKMAPSFARRQQGSATFRAPTGQH